MEISNLGLHPKDCFTRRLITQKVYAEGGSKSVTLVVWMDLRIAFPLLRVLRWVLHVRGACAATAGFDGARDIRVGRGLSFPAIVCLNSRGPMVGKGADGVSPEFAFHTVGRSRFGCLDFCASRLDDFDDSDPRVTIIKAFCMFFRQDGKALLERVLSTNIHDG